MQRLGWPKVSPYVEYIMEGNETVRYDLWRLYSWKIILFDADENILDRKKTKYFITFHCFDALILMRMVNGWLVCEILTSQNFRAVIQGQLGLESLFRIQQFGRLKYWTWFRLANWPTPKNFCRHILFFFYFSTLFQIILLQL